MRAGLNADRAKRRPSRKMRRWFATEGNRETSRIFALCQCGIGGTGATGGEALHGGDRAARLLADVRRHNSRGNFASLWHHAHLGAGSPRAPNAVPKHTVKY